MQDGSDAVDGIIGAEMILDTWEVAVVMDFMLPAAEWLAGTWDACSTDCGEGSTSRTISCTLGGTLGCATMEQPTDKQSCEGSDCPPYCVLLGSKDRASCGAGAVAVVSGGIRDVRGVGQSVSEREWWTWVLWVGEGRLGSAARRVPVCVFVVQVLVKVLVQVVVGSSFSVLIFPSISARSNGGGRPRRSPQE